MKELKEIPKENPFRVPDDYFSSLENRIFTAIEGTEPAEIKNTGVFRLRRVLAIAASVTILAAIGIIAAMLTERVRNNPFPGDISISSEAYLYEIDILTLEESVAEKDIFPEKTGVDSKDIIDYLVFENIDETDIYEKTE